MAELWRQLISLTHPDRYANTPLVCAAETCVRWLPSQRGMPIPTREGFMRLYPNERAYFARHAREPAEPSGRVVE
jgi:hypothetical protein